MFPLLMLSRAPSGEGCTPAAPCPTPGIAPRVPGCTRSPRPPAREAQPCGDPTKHSSRPDSRTRVHGLLPAPACWTRRCPQVAVLMPGGGLGRPPLGCRLCLHHAWARYYLQLLLLFLICRSRVVQKCGAGGWVDGHRGQSRCWSVGPHHGTAEPGRSILQSRGGERDRPHF